MKVQGVLCRLVSMTVFWGSIGVVGTLLASGCSVNVGGSSDGIDEVATQRSALDEGGSEKWKAWSPWTQPFPGSMTRDPALCSNDPSTFVVVGLNDNDGKYYVDTANHPVLGGNAWTAFGQRAFNSAPSCAYDKPYRYAEFHDGTQPRTFVFSGRGTDGKIYAVHGHENQGSGGSFPPNPTPDTGTVWVAVNNNASYSGNYGRPALSSNGSLIALTFLTSDRKINAYTHPVPYVGLNSKWSTIKTGPALPTGVTSDGIPAIVYVRGPNNPVNNNPVNKFVVMVRGISAGTAGLYWIYFNGSTWGSWTQAFIQSPVLSDPAMEYDDQADALSVYFKNDTGTIMRTAVHIPEQLGLYPFDLVGDDAGTVSAPRVVFGAGFETGIRTGITVKNSTTLLWIEDQHMDPFFPFTQKMGGAGGAGAACAESQIPSQQESFANNAVGCPGTLTWDARTCGSGSRPCTANEWRTARGSSVPAHNYWTNDNLRYSGSGSNACSVSTTAGNQCPTNQPMRVCTPNGSDPEGNSCNWTHCGYSSTSPDQYFGGCAGNATAGVLCCLSVL